MGLFLFFFAVETAERLCQGKSLTSNQLIQRSFLNESTQLNECTIKGPIFLFIY